MQEIRNRLETELTALERELRTELPREIQLARELGDLRENAEYQAALERQSIVRSRMAQIQKRLAELSRFNMNAIPTDRVHLGSRITVRDLDTEDEHRYEIVVPEAAEAARGRISPASPIGRGLMGRKVGDEVTIRIPSGQRSFEILSLRTIHEKDGESGGSAA